MSRNPLKSGQGFNRAEEVLYLTGYSVAIPLNRVKVSTEARLPLLMGVESVAIPLNRVKVSTQRREDGNIIIWSQSP